MADSHFYAWLAGFVDGEGTLYIANKFNKSGDNRYDLQLRIANTCLETMVYISKQTDRKLDSYIGHLKHPIAKPCYSIRWFNHNALNIINKIEPYLITKKRQAQIARDFKFYMPHVGSGARVVNLFERTGRGICREEMKILNRKGKENR